MNANLFNKGKDRKIFHYAKMITSYNIYKISCSFRDFHDKK